MEIAMYASSTPKDAVKVNDEENAVEILKYKISLLFIDLKNAIEELQKLEMLKEYLDEHKDVEPKNLVS